MHEKLEEIVGLFGALLSKARAVRRLGSAAIDLCYVAAGRLDGFWEEGLKPGTSPAASLIVQEAGGRVTSLDGGPFVLRSGRIIATNGLLHDEMRAVIADYYASREVTRRGPRQRTCPPDLTSAPAQFSSQNTQFRRWHRTCSSRWSRRPGRGPADRAIDARWRNA